ncbi:MAG: hypothetical protein IPI64_12480 [Chloracidobacterium sp.]|nr:hypothetical protein [Chloracidobacterium sp.]MBK8304466.1 hypothetical protein [Chloracidobacterium sp.]
MSFTRESAAELAITDLAKRLNIDVGSVDVVDIDDKDFPDMSLGAAIDGEMSAQMISSGWLIKLSADSENYEYRADKYQLRLHNFKGKNYVIQS